MEIGLKFTSPQTTSRSDAIELFARADQLGYHSLWAGERFAPDLFLTLAEMAFRTERILLGSAVVNVFSRTPAAVATAAATLDQMSQGRLLLGLGVSGRVVVEDWHGLPFDRPYQRLREYVEIIRQIIGSWRVQHEGEVLQVGGQVIEMTPLRDRIPTYIGALGPKAIRLTGEIGDGWIPVMNAPDAMQGDFGELLAGATSANRDVKDVTVAPDVLVLVTDDKPGARRLMRSTMARSMSGRGAYFGDRAARAGFPEEVGRVIDLWRRRKRQEAVDVISDQMVDAFCLYGSREEILEGLEHRRSAGWGVPLIRFPAEATLEQVFQTIEALAPR